MEAEEGFASIKNHIHFIQESKWIKKAKNHCEMVNLGFKLLVSSFLAFWGNYARNFVSLILFCERFACHID
ncbi:hypothetical protein J4211_02690 [Candidatus Woesearchaeota archaeon]|nr:hypothetical protein [Candidatus Woesearchaeota archaeon]